MKLFTAQSKAVIERNSNAQVIEVSMYSLGFKGTAISVPQAGVKCYSIYELATDKLLATYSVACTRDGKLENLDWVSNMLNVVLDLYLIA